MKNIFTQHPHSIGETYLQHFFFASKFAFGMIFGGVACLLHAIFPFIFKNTGSNFLLGMTHHFIARMPADEPRVVKLTQALNGKLKNKSREEDTVSA